MTTLLWILIAFISGSLPFSLWLGRVFLGTDIRQYGDGNPGATNVFRAGSPVLGITVLLLDVAKAALPIGFCYNNLSIRGIPMLLIATAPLLGHSFSPFLNFRGGKALAATLGAWIGLTTWKASLSAVIGVVVGVLVLSSAGWGVMLAMAAILLTLLIWLPSGILLGIWGLQTILLAWTHRQDLKQPPAFHPRIKSLLSREPRG
jgi:glycerol-3-phosphate acyltransferase PlsY